MDWRGIAEEIWAQQDSVGSIATQNRHQTATKIDPVAAVHRLTVGARGTWTTRPKNDPFKKFEEQLKHYNSLTPAERREERSRYQAFNQFPPEKQNQARRLFRQFGELPQERQGPIRQEFEHLRALPEAERRARINSDEFRNKYDSHEQKFLSDLSGLLSPPQ